LNVSARLTSLVRSAHEYFDRLQGYVEPGRDLLTQLVDEDREKSKDIEAQVAQVARAALASEQGPLIGDADRKDLRISIHRISAALRLRGYQQWDAEVVFDQDVYRGTKEAGQSEYVLESVDRAKREFEAAADHLSRIAMLAVPLASDVENDDLLPLLRRRPFDRDIVECVEAAATMRLPLTLLMVDVDHFKKVNDDNGHPVGDEALNDIAQVVKSTVGDKGHVYRYGGEELAVLVENYTADEGLVLAERIRRDVEKAPRTSKSLTLTISVGVATCPDHAATSGDLVRTADQALYGAKDAGRNTVRAYSPAEAQRFRNAVVMEQQETAVGIAQRIHLRKETEAKRIAFVFSEVGARAALREVGELLDALQRRAKDIADSIHNIVERRANEMLWIYSSGFTLVVDWHLPYVNTTREARLYVLHHKGRVGPGMYANRDQPRELSRDFYTFDLEGSDQAVWRRKDGKAFTSSSLAEELIKELLGRVES
jgi:diguanylate cyclase (GGDEF)-like protein